MVNQILYCYYKYLIFLLLNCHTSNMNLNSLVNSLYVTYVVFYENIFIFPSLCQTVKSTFVNYKVNKFLLVIVFLSCFNSKLLSFEELYEFLQNPRSDLYNESNGEIICRNSYKQFIPERSLHCFLGQRNFCQEYNNKGCNLLSDFKEIMLCHSKQKPRAV